MSLVQTWPMLSGGLEIRPAQGTRYTVRPASATVRRSGTVTRRPRRIGAVPALSSVTACGLDLRRMPVYRVVVMAEDTREPAAYAADIDAARDRLVSFVSSCGEEEWRAAPLDGDPRPVAVVVDHVADAYEYLAGWISQLVAGQPAEVNSEVVDALNAQHARDAARVSRAEATEHLRRSGEAISRLVAGLSAAGLAAGDGRVRRLAQIAAWHADDHRADIETALAARAIRRGLPAGDWTSSPERPGHQSIHRPFPSSCEGVSWTRSPPAGIILASAGAMTPGPGRFPGNGAGRR